jgi:hypothetical protein
VRSSGRRTWWLTSGGAAEVDAHPSSFLSEGHEDPLLLGAFVGDLPDGLLFRLSGTRGTDAVE